MKILWLCNIMLPMIAKHYHMEASNKEGWLSGLMSVVLKRKQQNGIELVVAFPAPAELLRDAEKDVIHARITHDGQEFEAYGFAENTGCPDVYDVALENRLSYVVETCRPDMVHCFGTEYPHTLAMCKVFPDKRRILVGIQGLCAVYANAYFANLPEKVIHSVTFRDWLKKDSIMRQQQKFAERGRMEIEALKLSGNITGRTAWDEHYAKEWNPDAVYYFMNETLRPQFYDGIWQEENCVPHSIFLSQGDYPIKGLHYMLLALPEIRRKYPDVHVYVAGNSIVKYDTIKDKIKISAYGKYLRKLMKENDLWKQVTFLGRMDAQEMKAQYLKSHLFVCCSSIENSPNSLGEAMLLGVPCVSAAVGGIASIFDGGKDGILYEGYKTSNNSFDNINNNMCNRKETTLEDSVKSLVAAVLEMWNDSGKMCSYCKNARNHALKNHDREKNYQKMTEIYAKILENGKK